MCILFHMVLVRPHPCLCIWLLKRETNRQKNQSFKMKGQVSLYIEKQNL